MPVNGCFCDEGMTMQIFLTVILDNVSVICIYNLYNLICAKYIYV